MSGYLDILFKHARLIILRTINSTGGDRLNESILHDIVLGRGVVLTRDQIVTNMQWLDEQGLVNLSELGGVKIATLTQAGAEVATGTRLVDGVKRPSPKA